MTVNRRTVLAALGTSVATAGCFGTGSPDPGSAPTDSTPTDTPAGPFADVPCPSFTEADRTVCWHARTEGAPVVLEPSATTYRPVEGNSAVETLRFALRNRSERTFGLNPYAWQLHARADGGWDRVAPDEWIEPWYTVAPGETHAWVLATEQHPSPDEGDVVQIVEALDPTVHALAVDGTLGTESEEPETVECVALFDVVDLVQDTQETTATDG